MARVAVLSSAVLFLIVSGASADTIEQYDGRKIECRVVAETYSEVQYKISGVSATQKISADKVRKVVYGKIPQDYQDAQGFLEDGAYEEARSLFKASANNASKRNAWVKQYGLFMAAECLRFMNKWEDAYRAYDELITKEPKTRFLPEALLNKATCRFYAGKVDQAKSLADQLAKDAKDKGFGERWVHESDYFKTFISEKSNPSGALEKYKGLHRSTERKFPEVANKARLRIGYVYINQGKLDDARTYFEEIIDNRTASAAPIVAGAYNGLGTSLVSKRGATPADTRAALLHFLRVVYHYPQVRAEQPRALFWSGKIFKQLGDIDADRRAKRLLSRCQKEYPGTSWAEQASKEG